MFDELLLLDERQKVTLFVGALVTFCAAHEYKLASEQRIKWVKESSEPYVVKIMTCYSQKAGYTEQCH